MNSSILSKIHVGIAVLAITITVLALGGSANAAAPLSIGTNPQGSVAYAVGAAVANISSEKAGLQMRVVPQGGPPVTVPMLNKGRLDCSIANGYVAAAAHKGITIFKDRPQEKVRILCYLFPLHVGYYARKDSEIKSLADLKGKRVPSRFTKQLNNSIMSEALLATVGLTWDDVIGVPVPNGVRGVDDFAAGSNDAAFFSLSSGKTLQANAAVNGIRVLPIPDTQKANEAIEDHVPGAFISTLDPENSKIPGILTPTRVLSLPFVVLVSADVPEDTAYKIVKALSGSKDKMVGMHKSFNNFDPKGMALDIGVPYHPGAVKFYKEVGLK